MEDKIYDVDSLPILERDCGINYKNSMSAEEKVNYLVQNLRLTINHLENLADLTKSECLDTKWVPFQKNKYHLEQDDLKGEGKAVTELLIKMHWEKEDLSFEKIDIAKLSELFPEEQRDLKEKLQENTHSFAIVTIGNKRYIIDCAYRQFFSLSNHEEKQELDLKEFMSNDESKRNLAKRILKYGWIEATPENLKNYLDGFIMLAAKDEQIKLPTQQEYLKNIEGQALNVVGKVIQKYELKELWKIYRKMYFPDISDETMNFATEHRDIFMKIKNSLAFNNDTFSIVMMNDKKYIRTKSQDIEFSPENLKNYLDEILIQLAENENIVTPTIQEYQRLYPCEEPTKRSYQYIIDSEPYIVDKDVDFEEFSEEMSDEEKLTNIVQKERNYLMKNHDLTTDSLAGECEDSTLRVLIDSASKGFEEGKCLFPASYLENGSVGHNCSIISSKEKSYLVDCTYRQFFSEELAEQCGIYMLNDEKRKEVAKQILKYGWIEATPENVKAYMDGFEMGKRKSFEETGITKEEYMKRFSEHQKCPLHIITSRQIMEADIKNEITLEEMKNAEAFVVNLGRKVREVEKES